MNDLFIPPINQPFRHPQWDFLTLREARRVVIDVAEGDVDGGGGGKPPQLTSHVLGLEKNLVLPFYLTIHVW